MQGEFFWYDVMTTDTKAAAAFYGAVVGWQTQDAGGADGQPYTLFTMGGQGVAGLMPVPDHAKGMPPCWFGYVRVDDVDAAVAKLEKLGGKIVRPPCDVPGVIRFAVVADPQGAGFLIAKPFPREAPPPLPVGTPGTIGWRELYAGDGAGAFAFYEALFGWTKAESYDMGPMGTYQLFATGGAAVGGIMTKPPGVPHPAWGYYFNIASIDAPVERVKTGGGTILHGPTEVPGGQWIVQCLDPQGAYFGLVAPGR